MSRTNRFIILTNALTLSACSIMIDTDPFTYGTGQTDDSGSESASEPAGTESLPGDTQTEDTQTEAGTDTGDTASDIGTASEEPQDTGTGTQPEPDTGTGASDTGTGAGDTGTGNGGEDTGTGVDTGTGAPDTGTGDICENGWLDKDNNLCWEMPFRNNRINADRGPDRCGELGEGWRVPTIEQLRKLIRDCPSSEYKTSYIDGECKINDFSTWQDSTLNCGGCEEGRGPADNGCYSDPTIEDGDFSCIDVDIRSTTVFWSSSAFLDGGDNVVWVVDFATAEVDHRTALSTALYNLRCVKTLSK